MSIILKGIDMPKEGEWLSVIIKPTKEVIVDTIRYGDYALLKTEYGLAIQIPRVHGRLVDADDMQDKAYKRYFNNTISSYGMFEVNRAIDNAPTILEGEDE